MKPSPIIILAIASAILAAPMYEVAGQDRDGEDIQQKIQDAIQNVLNDEIQGELSGVLDKLARRIDTELTDLMDDKQIQGLAEAIENGDVQGALKQLNIKPGYSVGLHLRKVEEDGQKQIKVIDVVQGSPAAKAGIEKGDVIRAVNDREIDSINTLLDVIKRSGGRELKFKLTRDAMAELVRVKPMMQVAGVPIDPAQAKQVEMLLGALQGDLKLDALGGVANMKDIEKMFGALMGELDNPPAVMNARPRPNVVRPKPVRTFDQLPANVSMTIQKSGDQPAKITVSRDDEVWEIDESEIEDLPVELRPYVRNALGVTVAAKKPAVDKNAEFERIQRQLQRLQAEMKALEDTVKNQK